jgi:bifunctional DNA-binding transcriptional regulator/antitoxin component of YhaV-PrlF toxin-antitoxin module
MKSLTFQANIIEQYRLTVPKATRDLLKIGIGDTVIITIEKGDER